MEDLDDIVLEQKSDAKPTDLNLISSLADAINLLEMEIALLEDEKRLKAERLFDLVTNKLPEAMLSVNMRKFELEDGSQVQIKDVVQASIPKPKQEEAFAWLRNNEHGDLIKHVVSVSLDRGKDNVAHDLVSRLKTEYGLDADNKESVHPQTLSAFCRDMLEKGQDLPSDLLGLWVGKKAVIKRSQ